MKNTMSLVVFVIICLGLASRLIDRESQIQTDRFLPLRGDVFTVATSPFQDKEFVRDYDETTLPALLPRLQLLPQFTSGDPPAVMKDYRHQEGVIVLKDKRVLYFRAVFESEAYLKSKRVGWISFTPPYINDERFYALP